MPDDADQTKLMGPKPSDQVTAELIRTFVIQLGIEQSIVNAVVAYLASRSLVGDNLVAVLRGTTPPTLDAATRAKYGDLLNNRLDALETLIERYRREPGATGPLNG